MKCGAQATATQETKRKLNPLVTGCEASATQEKAPKGIMPPNRTRGLSLRIPLPHSSHGSVTIGHVLCEIP